MSPFKKSLFFLEYILFRVLAAILLLVPLRASYRIADALGVFIVRILGIRRRIMLENLRLAFKDEKNKTELLGIAEQSMQSLLKLVFEFLRTPEVALQPTRYLEALDIQVILSSLEGGKGLIAIVSHFGNWEWLAVPVKPFGLFSNAVGRPLKNPYLYDYVRRVRKIANLRNIDKDGAVRASILAIKRNEILAVLIDQHESRGAVWVDFFGRKASTSTLPAMMALKYGTPVIPVFFYRNENGCSQVRYGPEFPLIKTGDLQADLLANTQQYVAKIEEEIRKRPGDWLWAHRRWRTPPAHS